jgi:hypothetical protein
LSLFRGTLLSLSTANAAGVQVVVLVLLLACAMAVIANAEDTNPESSSGLVGVLEARSQVRFPIAKCKNSQNQPANGQDTVKPGSCSGRTTFACCGYGGSSCVLPVPGQDFKGTGCRYLYFGACCEF